MQQILPRAPDWIVMAYIRSREIWEAVHAWGYAGFRCGLRSQPVGSPTLNPCLFRGAQCTVPGAWLRQFRPSLRESSRSFPSTLGLSTDLTRLPSPLLFPFLSLSSSLPSFFFFFKQTKPPGLPSPRGETRAQLRASPTRAEAPETLRPAPARGALERHLPVL